VTPEDDPGWWPALQPALRWILPWYWFPLTRKRRFRAQPPGLIAMRTIYVGLVWALPSWVIAFSFIAPWDGGDEGPAAYIVVAVGLTHLGWIVRVMRRQLATSSLEALAASYRTRMFIGVGLSEVTVLVAITTTFLFQDSLWLIVLGAAFSLVDFWLAAPSKRNLAGDQARLFAQGSALNLVAALNSPPDPRPD
jgi:F0F1-type ATP synthase membrane subunit c/vacuolar-type H+-ATPase subunit K